MTAHPNYPTDKLVIKYLLCGGAVGGLIMGALAMHNELRFADNLLDIVFGAVGLVLVFMLYGTMVGFPYVVVCTVLLQDIFMYHNGTREPFALQQTTAVAMLTCIGSALIVGAFALPRQPEKGGVEVGEWLRRMTFQAAFGVEQRLNLKSLSNAQPQSNVIPAQAGILAKFS